jgi:hypothetical protein
VIGKPIFTTEARRHEENRREIARNAKIAKIAGIGKSFFTAETRRRGEEPGIAVIARDRHHRA